MKASRDLKPLFIRKEEIPDGGIIVVIAYAERKDMSVTAGEQDFQWLLTFKEGWRLRLNPINLRHMIELCGDETDHWPGKRIGLILAEFQTKEGTTKQYIKVVPAPGVTLKRKLVKETPEPDQVDNGDVGDVDSDESLFA
jgi:hypothetical protein